jgi:hypothetical protein
MTTSAVCSFSYIILRIHGGRPAGFSFWKGVRTVPRAVTDEVLRKHVVYSNKFYRIGHDIIVGRTVLYLDHPILLAIR